jgi:glycerate dehydrogenase
MEAAREHGVVVSNVSGYARFAVPQHAFALLLNLAGRVWRYIEDVRRGDWAAQNSFTLLRYPTFELAGKTLGIVGFGSTGRGAARIAEGFGMRVVPHNSSAFEEPPYRNHSFDQLLAESDAITIHCPLTSQTRDLFDAAAFTRMKSSALLVNTARGGIVNEHALLDALKKRTIAGAALDVLSEEPPRDNPLLAAELDNLIVTPHTAWSARAARRRLIEETARNIAAFAEGRRRNVVSESSRRGGHGSSDGGGSSTPQQSS